MGLHGNVSGCRFQRIVAVLSEVRVSNCSICTSNRVSKWQRRQTWHEPLTQVDPAIGDVVGGPRVHAGVEPGQPCRRATAQKVLLSIAGIAA